LSQEYKYKYPA